MKTKEQCRLDCKELMKTCKYLYGAKGQKYTKTLVTKLAKAYPDIYTDKIKKLALEDADKGYTAIDCSGFVCSVLGIKQMGSSQLKNVAVKTLPVLKSNAKEGMILWKMGHVAYVGEGLKVYEASGTATDMKVSEFDKRAKDFTCLLVIKNTFASVEKSKKSYDKIVDDVIAGKYGNGLKRRAALEKAGYSYEIIQALVNEKLYSK